MCNGFEKCDGVGMRSGGRFSRSALRQAECHGCLTGDGDGGFGVVRCDQCDSAWRRALLLNLPQMCIRDRVNIAAMKVFRQERNSVAYMIIETDQDVPKQALLEIAAMEPVLEVKFVKPF